MFGRNTPQIDLAQIRPSSKMSLKMSCLSACGNNVEEAQKLYDFIASDINLPDTDVMSEQDLYDLALCCRRSPAA